MNDQLEHKMQNVFPVKSDQAHQQPDVCSGPAVHADWRYSLAKLVLPALMVCLVSLLLGTSIFAIAAENGNLIGYMSGYVGGAFRRFTQFFAIPLWFIAWHFARSQPEFRVKFDISTLIPLFMLLLYISVHLLIADTVIRGNRLEMVFSSAPIVLLALPLCHRKGCELFWYGMIVASIVFFMTLLFSGQFLSIMHGEGLIALRNETSSRLHLGLDTISSASIMYQCVLGGILWLLTYSRKSASTLLILATSSGLLMCGVMTGSKGPMISLIVALVTVILVKRVLGMKKWLCLAIIGVIFYRYGLPALSDYVGSMKHLAIGFNDENRYMFYSYVLKSFPTLCGRGIGSFAHNMGFSVGGYVHNSILEMYYEMGLIGAGVFIWAVVAIGRKLIIAARHDLGASFILAYFVYSLTFSMFSGSIFSDKELWLAFAFGCTRFLVPVQGKL